MIDQLAIVATADGSNTIYNPQVGEHYHSKHGALQESIHVFLNSGLKYYLEKEHTREARILEVGFGTGLNFLLSADFCNSEQIRLTYSALEAYPLSDDMIFSTGYERFVTGDIWQQFKKAYPAALSGEEQMGDFCSLAIDTCDLLQYEASGEFDVVYFDAFAAVHQPEMWEIGALERATRNLRSGGLFVTYAITGNLKRAMKSLGFSIEKAPGAPGKREMLRALKG